MRLPFHRLLCLLLPAAIITGCNSSDCPLNNTVAMVCQFCESASGETLTLHDTLTVAVRDSVILNRAIQATTVSLPMSYSSPADTLVFRYTPEGAAQSQCDTLIVTKTNRPHVVSLECGTSVFHTITAVSCSHRTADATYRYAIDSAVVIKPEVNYDKQTNLKIYLTVHQ